MIWIIPNQRKNMLKTTPYLVAYAEFLLLATYVFGMDLTDDELPSNVDVSKIVRSFEFKFHLHFNPIDQWYKLTTNWIHQISTLSNWSYCPQILFQCYVFCIITTNASRKEK